MIQFDGSNSQQLLIEIEYLFIIISKYFGAFNSVMLPN